MNADHWLIKKHRWRTVLLKERDKVPEGAHWIVLNPDDTTQLDRHVGNVGLVCGPQSGIAVVDIDRPEIAQQMFEVLGPLEVTVITGSGKWHCYVKWEPGLAARIYWKGEKIGEVQRGQTDLEAAERLQHVVMPPSIHPCGEAYRWNQGMEDWVPPSLPARWKLHLQLGKGYSDGKEPAVNHGFTLERRLELAEKWLAERKPAIQGNGGDTHTYVTTATVCHGYDIPDAMALRLLLKWNRSCQPPWSEKELKAKIRSANRSATGARGEKLLQYESEPAPPWIKLGDTRGVLRWEEPIPKGLEDVRAEDWVSPLQGIIVEADPDSWR